MQLASLQQATQLSISPRLSVPRPARHPLCAEQIRARWVGRLGRREGIARLRPPALVHEQRADDEVDTSRRGRISRIFASGFGTNALQILDPALAPPNDRLLDTCQRTWILDRLRKPDGGRVSAIVELGLPIR